MTPVASWSDAHATAWATAGPPAAALTPLGDASGRVLAAPIVAAAPSPAFDAAAMDGYAVAGPGPWRVVGRVLAGGPALAGPLAPGEAIEIATGARVPAGCQGVVPYEDCHRSGETVAGAVTSPHIRRAGEDAAAGEVLVPSGGPLTAAAAGLCAQIGVDRVWVYPRPVVDVFVTGDEVILHGRPSPGQVRDAFGPLLTAVVARAGGTLRTYAAVPDDAGALASCLDTSAADVAVVTGSSSAGAADHLRAVLDARAAAWPVDGVACRPGHPQTLARTAAGRWVVGLPGNPYAGLVAALTLLEPLLSALSGRARRPLPMLPVTGPAATHPAHARIVPVTTTADGARIVPGARSASLRAAAAADALAVLDGAWTTGTPAPLLLLP
ncbi:molybdopterin molybdotransferase MoeA [Dactylosporangium sp. NPDC000244]|uniref:molybdopterin molybdotransferase MoeA n=1 Tax=Dactylosporangium sp. NPDC000244 TaxID=3154365 RepID=UPI003332720E